jgi:hypothetical protein
MSKQVNGPEITMQASEDLVAFRRVKISGSTVVYADAGDGGIGVVQAAVDYSEDANACIRLDNAGGTSKMMASGVISAGAKVYPDADGKITATAISPCIGTALEASTADDDIIEVLNGEKEGEDVVESEIWVAPYGDDTNGTGTRTNPYLTITKALASVTASRKTIIIAPGSYTETLSLTWPSITGVSINGMLGHGDAVTIVGTAGQTQVISIDPTVQTATFEATISNLTISCPDGVRGITFNNTNVGRKINLYLNNVPIENDTETDRAISVVHTTAGNAMRIYASGQKSIVEGLLYINPNNADDRFTFDNYQFDGGVQFGTTTVVSVSTFKDCIMKDAGGSGGQDTQILNSCGCYSLTGTTYAAAALNDFAANAAEVIL